MGKEDDIIPTGYQYEWTPKSDTTLQEFLAKVRPVLRVAVYAATSKFTRNVFCQYKPSMVQNDGTKPVCVPRVGLGAES